MKDSTAVRVKEKQRFTLHKNQNKSPRGEKGVILLVVLIAAVLTACLVLFGIWLFSPEEPAPETAPATVTEEARDDSLPDWVDVQLIAVDGESRRGEAIEAVTAIALHYVANPGTTAQQNRNYFNNPDSTVSAHFVIGLEGEVILCVPLNEKSSATNARNRDTVSIELCHPDATGRFTEKTEASLIRLLAYLLDRYKLDEENIIRHYDVTGKLCPLYYVEHPEAFEKLKRDADAARKGGLS